jgi:hypothetical protein
MGVRSFSMSVEKKLNMIIIEMANMLMSRTIRIDGGILFHVLTNGYR